MKIYKKLTEEYEGQLFKNYNLTELMLLKKKDRKIKINENSALCELLIQKLEEYGLSLFGQFERDNLTFRGIRMFDDFPIENEPILKQLYGYIDFTANIQLRGFDNFAVAFNYNVDSGECELQRHSWGTVTHRLKFSSLFVLLEYIKTNGYDNLFND
jgi:hypothetical protein